MYSIEIHGQFMAAHSFKGDVFGPAQALHGATFEVDVALYAPSLDAYGIVADIGKASQVLKEILDELNYKNLDEINRFAGYNTTTEVLCHAIYQSYCNAVYEGRLGRPSNAFDRVRVTIAESSVARASFEAPLGESRKDVR